MERAYILIKTRIGEIPEVVRFLRKSEGVISADMTFGPYDVVAVVEAEDICEIAELVATTIQCTPGVVDTLTCPACTRVGL
jgi:uncharacterized protein with GYD domain